MFEAVSEAERDVITVVVFIVTFFVALGIGRFLKRRAGVQLGLFFRLFCLISRVLCRHCGLRSPCIVAISYRCSSDFVEHGTDCRARESLRLGFLLRKETRKQRFRIFSAR